MFSSFSDVLSLCFSIKLPQVRNWSSRLAVGATLELEAAYYNAHVALWEPVLEPVSRPNGGRGGKLQRWTLDFR
jgi:hypothetical protein